MNRPSPEELRRRLTERLAAEAPRGNTMTPVAEAPAPVAPSRPKPVAPSRPPERIVPTTTTPAAPKAPLATKPTSTPKKRNVVRRNDERGRLRSHPVDESLYLAIAKAKLRASKGRRMTWDEILQAGLDIVLSRPGQLESLLTEVDTFQSKARRTVAATVSADHDIAMQELLLENRSLGEVRTRLKLEDLWCAALVAWRRSLK